LEWRPVYTDFNPERARDTENKLLDAVGRGINGNPNVRETIQLFTERWPCPGCSDVIAEFGRKQPFITFMVVDNNGDVIMPAR
jgi:filamentous hemagglutinin